MRLHHPYMQHILHCQEGTVPLLVVEAPHFFRAIIEDLTRQIEGEDGVCVLSRSYEPLDISKHLRVIDRYTSYDTKERRLLAKFQEYIRDLCREELAEERAEFDECMQRCISSLIRYTSYPLQYEIPGIEQLFVKSLGISPEVDVSDPLERLIGYMDLINGLIPDQVFILVHPHEYFESDEMKALVEHILAQKWYVMLLEQHVPEAVCEHIETHIIDADLCEL